jgi:hypothetical protein
VGSLNCLQIIAWANVIHDYSAERSLEEAAAMTFSGDHPCEMCLTIADAKAEEQTPLKAPVPCDERQNLRFEFQALAHPDLPKIDHWRKPPASPRAGQTLLTLSRVEESVPTPPPRPALA